MCVSINPLVSLEEGQPGFCLVHYLSPCCCGAGCMHSHTYMHWITDKQAQAHSPTQARTHTHDDAKGQVKIQKYTDIRTIHTHRWKHTLSFTNSTHKLTKGILSFGWWYDCRQGNVLWWYLRIGSDSYTPLGSVNVCVWWKRWIHKSVLCVCIKTPHTPVY